MSLSKDQDAIEFSRIIEELKDFAEEMDDYSRKFVYDNAERIEKYGDSTKVSEGQLSFARRLYEKYC